MFFIRNACIEDLGELYELSHLEMLLNLPRDRKRLEAIIENSLASFKKPNPQRFKNHYLFVLKDFKKSKIVGSCLIHGQHGTDQNPHFFFRISQEKKYSSIIKKEFTHDFLEIDYEPNGYSEIGALILHPDYRGRKERLGKQLSFARFLYMAINPSFFTETIHAELLPPVSEGGTPPLWKAIGEKFTGMSYDEANRLSFTDKEFILNLFPWGDKIYTALLPKEALEAIGQVGPNTKPVKAMLEKIGFHDTKEFDPFDGGPHYRCRRYDILPIKKSRLIRMRYLDDNDMEKAIPYLIELKKNAYAFCCTVMMGLLDKDTLFISQSMANQYDIEEGVEVFCTPM
ncbi:MAG: arginine N-succinyltransferase [Bacteriovoracales bacterium]|nr:arginine N-succinyltransferase [Bacteriovoracales bacterium]